jgi:hypothetical protein
MAKRSMSPNDYALEEARILGLDYAGWRREFVDHKSPALVTASGTLRVLAPYAKWASINSEAFVLPPLSALEGGKNAAPPVSELPRVTYSNAPDYVIARECEVYLKFWESLKDRFKMPEGYSEDAMRTLLFAWSKSDLTIGQMCGTDNGILQALRTAHRRTWERRNLPVKRA